MEVYVHGVAEKVNGKTVATFAWVAIDQDGNDIAQDYGVLNSSFTISGNLAAYEALVRAMRWAKKQRHFDCTFFSCLTLIVGQTCGGWVCNSAALWPFAKEARNLLTDTESTIRYTTKRQNPASTLAWAALNETKPVEAGSI
jgi:ribonuclease HI